MSFESSKNSSPSAGYCPFRVSPSHSHIDCVLQLGTASHCYSQDDRPLLRRDNYYMCPLVTKLTISLEYQDELSQFISRLLVTQDETIVFNLWPLLGGTDDFGRDFETPPFPYIYYFPYPKGPPLPSAEALSKLMICPSCLSKCEIDAKYCSVCGYRFFSDE